jgi:hypothetical protein
MTATRGVDGPPVPAAFDDTTSAYTVVPFTSPPMVQVVVNVVQVASGAPPVAAAKARAM